MESWQFEAADDENPWSQDQVVAKMAAFDPFAESPESDQGDVSRGSFSSDGKPTLVSVCCFVWHSDCANVDPFVTMAGILDGIRSGTEPGFISIPGFDAWTTKLFERGQVRESELRGSFRPKNTSGIRHICDCFYSTTPNVMRFVLVPNECFLIPQTTSSAAKPAPSSPPSTPTRTVAALPTPTPPPTTPTPTVATKPAPTPPPTRALAAPARESTRATRHKYDTPCPGWKCFQCMLPNTTVSVCKTCTMSWMCANAGCGTVTISYPGVHCGRCRAECPIPLVRANGAGKL